jgi:hypothetical protein
MKKKLWFASLRIQAREPTPDAPHPGTQWDMDVGTLFALVGAPVYFAGSWLARFVGWLLGQPLKRRPPEDQFVKDPEGEPPS